jgi:hypothetical protein
MDALKLATEAMMGGGGMLEAGAGAATAAAVAAQQAGAPGTMHAVYPGAWPFLPPGAVGAAGMGMPMLPGMMQVSACIDGRVCGCVGGCTFGHLVSHEGYVCWEVSVLREVNHAPSLPHTLTLTCVHTHNPPPPPPSRCRVVI